ncbi:MULTISPECIES: hypothetical protein [unclassified Carboxylicivirga]|uniref:hypothetical protein n=1 Tax=Carboxylicivirga TaxID=1628153 RepID=UPI003D356FA3
MKTKLLLLPILLLLKLSVSAQSNWEIGGRFGDDFALDVTIPLSKAPRLHGALYFDNNISMGAYFDLLFALNSGPSGLKFYPGVGPELYFYDGLDIAAAGDFGVEYSFDFPLTIGLDWRPHFMLSDNMKFNSGNWGLIARFRFGEGVKFVKAH